ncbi:MAG TPA: S24 family peptidase [Gemmatimonadaceae bacterium]|nr:S24 family peptidase [Gemmatimonadaceae bacterium]
MIHRDGTGGRNGDSNHDRHDGGNRDRSTVRPTDPWWLERLDADALTPDELERLEAESDPLIHVLAHRERQRPHAAAYDDPRFAAWLVTDGGWDDDAPLDDAAIAALATRVLATLQSERLGVRAVESAPQVTPIAGATPASAAVDALASRGMAAVLDLDVAAGSGRALWEVECDLGVALPMGVAPGRYLALRVRGESMEPLIHSGDVVLVRLDAPPQPLSRDSVVVARTADDGYVVKCVGAVTHRTIELCSLNAAFPPIRVPRRQNTVLGAVVLRWCGHGAERSDHARPRA